MDLHALEKRKQKRIVISLVVLCLAFVFFTVGFLQLNKKFVQALDVKQRQISSLIQEVGDLKEQGQELRGMVISMQEDGQKPVAQFRPVAAVTPAASAVAPKVKISPVQGTEYILVVGHHQMLTDTIMLVALQEAKNRVTLLSIPRDLYVNGRKINEYYYAYGAAELVKRVEDVTGVPIGHYAAVSMTAFEKFIDAIGGVDVNVDRALYDSQFPDGNGGYETFSISAGPQHMDGETALKYARSRHGNSDFDRAGRQQLVIEAAVTKLKYMNFLTDLSAAKKIYESVGSLFETDLGLLDALLYLQKFNNAAISGGNVLSTSNFLYPTKNENGQYILLPNVKDFSEVHSYLQSLVQ